MYLCLQAALGALRPSTVEEEALAHLAKAVQAMTLDEATKMAPPYAVAHREAPSPQRRLSRSSFFAEPEQQYRQSMAGHEYQQQPIGEQQQQQYLQQQQYQQQSMAGQEYQQQQQYQQQQPIGEQQYQQQQHPMAMLLPMSPMQMHQGSVVAYPPVPIHNGDQANGATLPLPRPRTVSQPASRPASAQRKKRGAGSPRKGLRVGTTEEEAPGASRRRRPESAPSRRNKSSNARLPARKKAAPPASWQDERWMMTVQAYIPEPDKQQWDRDETNHQHRVAPRPLAAAPKPASAWQHAGAGPASPPRKKDLPRAPRAGGLLTSTHGSTSDL